MRMHLTKEALAPLVQSSWKTPRRGGQRRIPPEEALKFLCHPTGRHAHPYDVLKQRGSLQLGNTARIAEARHASARPPRPTGEVGKRMDYIRLEPFAWPVAQPTGDQGTLTCYSSRPFNAAPPTAFGRRPLASKARPRPGARAMGVNTSKDRRDQHPGTKNGKPGGRRRTRLDGLEQPKSKPQRSRPTMAVPSSAPHVTFETQKGYR